MAGSEFVLMLLADARLPTGAHTQSAGLEPGLRAGMRIGQVPRYIDARLRTVTTVEAGAAVLARQCAAAPGPDLKGRLEAIDEAWRARTASAALRANAEILGRGYSRLVRGAVARQPGRPRRATDAEPGSGGRRSASPRPPPASRRHSWSGSSPTTTRRPSRPPRSSCSRWTRSTATGWVLAAKPAVERMVGALSTMTAIDELPAVAAPLIEQWAELHATATQRLFRA